MKRWSVAIYTKGATTKANEFEVEAESEMDALEVAYEMYVPILVRIDIKEITDAS